MPRYQHKIQSLLFGLLLFILGCSQPATLHEKSLEKNIDFLISEGGHLWAQRNSAEMVDKARTLLTAAYREDPENFDLCVLLSRIYYYQAHYLEEDPFVQDSLYIAGKSIAEVGLRTELGMAENDSITLTALLSKTDQAHIGALYWWAANYGSYLITKPVMERMQHREAFEQILHHMLLINPNYFYGGPYRLFGVLYARIPGVDIERSGAYFDQAIAAYPDYLASKVLKAQFYYTKAGQREQFNAVLNEVISADCTVIPDLMPENLNEQELAKKLLAQESILFE